MVTVEDLLDLVCCPVERTALRVATRRELRDLNSAIAKGRARYASGAPVTEALGSGLTTAERSEYYRIDDGVPVLLPDYRITVGGASGHADTSGPVSPPTDPWASYWEKVSSHWDDLRPPRRPAPEDIALLQALVGETPISSGSAAPVALLLGVTPEIGRMCWPAGTRLFALDSSAAMIRNVWPARELPDAAVVRGDWRAMPFREGVCDLVVGDASIAGQPYPDSFFEVTGGVRRVLRDGGVLATRAFTRPERREPLDAIFADLRAGRIGTLDFLRWRLAAALHGDRTAGTRMCDIWDAWEANVADPQELMRSLGWPPETAQVMMNLRGGQAVLTFPTIPELRESLSPEFEEVACEFPAYEDGDRYPTLLFRSRPRSSGGARP